MFTNLPPVTKALLIINSVVFVLQLAVDPDVFRWFVLWPVMPQGLETSLAGYGFLPWQLISYGFIHADALHLFFNMLALLMFGAPVEYKWGAGRYRTYFLLCVAGAGLLQLVVTTWAAFHSDEIRRTVGASGGIYGLVLAYGMILPNQRIALFPLPLMLNARTVAIIFAVSSLLYGIFGSGDGVAHFSHLGGMITGYLLIRFGGGTPPFKRRPKTRKLRLVR